MSPHACKKIQMSHSEWFMVSFLLSPLIVLCHLFICFIQLIGSWQMEAHSKSKENIKGWNLKLREFFFKLCNFLNIRKNYLSSHLVLNPPDLACRTRTSVFGKDRIWEYLGQKCSGITNAVLCRKPSTRVTVLKMSVSSEEYLLFGSLLSQRGCEFIDSFGKRLLSTYFGLSTEDTKMNQTVCCLEHLYPLSSLGPFVWLTSIHPSGFKCCLLPDAFPIALMFLSHPRLCLSWHLSH